jgi:hypothetical protein
MGDTGEVFQEHRKHVKEAREKRTETNAQKLIELGITAIEQSKNVFRITTTRGEIMYYPGSNTWQHKGKIFHGDVKSFAGWVTNFQRRLKQEEQCSGNS